MELNDIRLNRREASIALLVGAVAGISGFGTGYFLGRKQEEAIEPNDAHIYKQITGKDVQSSLSAVAKDEFDINLRLPDQYAPQDIEKAWKILREIKEVNPALVGPLRGLDMFVLPDMRVYVNHGPLFNQANYAEQSRQSVNSIETLTHTLGISRAMDLGEDFLIGWRATTERSGFQYGYPKRSPMSKNQIVKSAESEGIFPQEEASILTKGRMGLPLEHVAQILTRIYNNQPLYASSRKAFDCYSELLKYAFDSKFLSEADYQHAMKLLQPFDIVMPNTGLKELNNMARMWSARWKDIADTNGIYNTEQLIGPVRVVIPLTEYISNNASPTLKNWDVHQIPKERMERSSIEQILKEVANNYRGYTIVTPEGRKPLVTPDYILQYNRELGTPEEIKGGCTLEFPVPKEGKMYKEVSITVRPLIKSSGELRIIYGNDFNP